jgi:thioredoxin reductase (NADPH)
MRDKLVYDVAVIGAGPAGTQAAVSAAHQLRHVLLLDAGAVSNRKGRAYWSKSVPIEDAPVFPGVSGPKLAEALERWVEAHPVRTHQRAGRPFLAGIERRAGFVLSLAKEADVFRLTASTRALRKGEPLLREVFSARTVVIASGFEDRWPDIERRTGERMLEQYRAVFRYAGNRKGWHVCIRCDGHLHVDQHIAILGVGDYIYETALGAQDFTDRLTILTNGRPHGMSPEVLRQAQARGIEIVEERIVAHVGRGSDLLGLRFADGSERFYDGFLVDEGLEPNTPFLAGWEVARDGDGLIVVGEGGAVLDLEGRPIPGLYAAGDVVAGTRKLIAAAFASGQDAGLSASDSLRRWRWPEAEPVAPYASRG